MIEENNCIERITRQKYRPIKKAQFDIESRFFRIGFNDSSYNWTYTRTRRSFKKIDRRKDDNEKESSELGTTMYCLHLCSSCSDEWHAFFFPSLALYTGLTIYQQLFGISSFKVNSIGWGQQGKMLIGLGSRLRNIRHSASLP